MLLDLDRFKAVNDTCGHDMGDQLLKAVADRFRSCVRQVDTVARMGGDEFAVILEGVSGRQDIVTVAQRIVGAIRKPFFIDGRPQSVGVSIGITVYPHILRMTRALTNCSSTRTPPCTARSNGAVMPSSFTQSTRTVPFTLSSSS